MIVSIIRTSAIYVLIICIMRFMGRRQIIEMQPSELVVTMLISNIASMPIENLDVPLILGIMPILLLLCFEYIISTISLKSRKFRKIISGKPIFIVENGKINQKALKALRYTIDDLTKNFRKAGIFNFSEIEYALVETDGNISVVKKFEAQNVTTKMLNIESKKSTIPLVIISDGKFIESNLKYLKISKNYIENFTTNNKTKIEDIFIMTSDVNKNIFFCKKDNK